MDTSLFHINTDYMARVKAPRSKRRVALSERKAVRVEELQARDFLIIRMHVSGMKNVEIARALGITSQSVSNLINSEIGANHIAEIQKAADITVVNLHNEFQQAAIEASRVMRDIIKGTKQAPVNTQVAVCKDMLDRAGYAPITKSQNMTVHGHFDSDDLERLKTRAQEVRKELSSVPLPDNVINL